MPANQLLITLPPHMADLVHRKVSSGEYADESAVIAVGLSFLEDDAEHFERWLREDVVAACREYEEDPSSAISSEELLLEMESARQIKLQP